VCEHRPTGSAHEAPIHSRAPGDTAGAAGSAGRLVEGRQCAAHEICQKSAVQCMRRHVPRPIQRPASSTCTRHESAQGTDRQTCRDPDTPSSGPAHPPDHVRPNTVRVKEPCRRGTWPARLLPKQTRLSGARLPLAGQGGYRVRIPPIWRARASSRGRAGTSRQGLGDDVMLVMSAVPGRVQPLRRTAELSPPGGRRSPPPCTPRIAVLRRPLPCVDKDVSARPVNLHQPSSPQVSSATIPAPRRLHGHRRTCCRAVTAYASPANSRDGRRAVLMPASTA
jgi:hypothetical protein